MEHIMTKGALDNLTHTWKNEGNMDRSKHCINYKTNVYKKNGREQFNRVLKNTKFTKVYKISRTIISNALEEHRQNNWSLYSALNAKK